jgi:hypothetical protein
MKKALAICLTGLLLLSSSCGAKTDIQTTSANPQGFTNSLDFQEDDFYWRLAQSGYTGSEAISSRPYFSDASGYYLTFPYLNQVYKFDQDGSYYLFLEDAWNILIRNGTCYYEHWLGTTDSPSSLEMYNNGLTKVLVEDCYYTYGKNAIYFHPFNNDVGERNDYKWYKMDYDTHKVTLLADLVSHGFDHATAGFICEYAGRLWFNNKGYIYQSDLDGKNFEPVFDENVDFQFFSNGFLYFETSDGIMKRYAITLKSIEFISNPFRDFKYYQFNIADTFLVVAGTTKLGEKGLYVIDMNFETKNKIMDLSNYEISMVSTIHKDIVLQYSRSQVNDQPNVFFMSVDRSGNIIYNYEIPYVG